MNFQLFKLWSWRPWRKFFGRSGQVFLMIFGMLLGMQGRGWGDDFLESCQEHCRESQRMGLGHLRDLEEGYAAMSWQHEKLRETLYVPLWDARIRKEDLFSTGRQAEGEVLYHRYRYLADTFASAAEESEKVMLQSLSGIQSDLVSLHHACPALSFKNCLAVWEDKILIAIQALDILLRKIAQHEKDLDAKVDQSVSESISAHDPYGPRIQKEKEALDTKYRPWFLSHLRDIRELLEFHFPITSCCELCTSENIQITENSRFNTDEMVLDLRQGDQGSVLPEDTIGEGLKNLQKEVRERKQEEDR